MLNKLLAWFCALVIGYSVIATLVVFDLKDQLKEIQNTYVQSLKDARAKEQEWRDKAYAIEEKYQQDLQSIKSSNDAVVNKLRKQLSEASTRVPSTCKTTNKSDGSTGESRVSKEITSLIEFSEHCARRLDESLVLNKALQDWIKNAR